MLENIFNEKAKLVESISDTQLERSPDLVKYTYEIFEDFYNPRDLKRMANSSAIESIYCNIKYALIQNSISVRVYDTLLSSYKLPDEMKLMDPICFIKVMDFHPRLKIPNVKVIHVDKYDKCEIGYFLLKEYYPLDEEDYYFCYHKNGFSNETQKRIEFLNRFISIMYFNKLNQWIIDTPPRKLSIRFNKNLTKAEVEFELISDVGTAYYERIGKKWRFVNSKITGHIILLN
jgi:hypothetical protein